MNASRFIRASLLSALSQTYDHLEIIVIDDGSTDDTVAVVEAMMASEPRIRLIQQTNAGVAAARNTGIKAARGEYLAPLDADDLWSERKIEMQVEKMEESDSPAFGMVYCWWYSVREDGSPTGGRTRFTHEGNVFLRLLYQNFVGNASVPLFRTDVVRSVGGYDEEPKALGAQGCEDWDLALKVAKKEPVGVVCEELSGYRDVSGSMSSSYLTMARSHELLIRHWRRLIPDLPGGITSWSTSHFCMWLAGKAYGAGHYWSACRFILRASLKDPAVFMLPWAGWILAAGFVRGFLSPVHRILGVSNAQVHELKIVIWSGRKRASNIGKPWLGARLIAAMNRRYGEQVSNRMLKLSNHEST